ncbi:hypothetical protein V8G56_00520 [Gaetbulibacter aquiaggeris]|uniref:DUF4136 domain-containing protein n=1 Tax=Gaetbulibacter aquiaggeris TaxID=1735373 RepID=A0ABW7MPV3_9FLAO
MKKTIYSIMGLTTLLVFNSCSSVKVLDSWKAENVSSINDKNIIVIARTENNQARIAFENEIVNQLTAKGLKATASFTKFPKLNPDEKVSEDKQEQIKNLLINEGFNAVVLTVIKDIKEATRTVTEGGYYAGATLYPRYYRGFYGYYYNPMSYSSFGNYVPETSTTFTSKTFVLESVAYNLAEPEDKQLIAVVTTQIENPSNITKVAQEYVKAITKSLVK